jgi:hypothetical protein
MKDDDARDRAFMLYGEDLNRDTSPLPSATKIAANVQEKALAELRRLKAQLKEDRECYDALIAFANSERGKAEDERALEAEVERLKREVNNARIAEQGWQRTADFERKRAGAAEAESKYWEDEIEHWRQENRDDLMKVEAERDRYREALEQIATQKYYTIPDDHYVKRIAREALEGKP